VQFSSEQNQPELAAVMPVYNEAANIRAVVREWFACLDKAAPDFALFVVDDGSTDRTRAILAQLEQELGARLRVIEKRNSGHGATCREAYEIAVAEGARWVFQVDSDGQCDPEFFPAFCAQRKTHDCVFGFRRTRDDGLGRVIVSRVCRIALWALTGTYLSDPNVPYRLISGAALRAALRSVPTEFELQNIAIAFVLKRDRELRWADIPIHFRARQGGKNKLNYRRMAVMGWHLLRELAWIQQDAPVPAWRPRWTGRGVAS
jgi:glycosyltransferase involved in cell wall biosynthesis